MFMQVDEVMAGWVEKANSASRFAVRRAAV